RGRRQGRDRADHRDEIPRCGRLRAVRRRAAHAGEEVARAVDRSEVLQLDLIARRTAAIEAMRAALADGKDRVAMLVMFGNGDAPSPAGRRSPPTRSRRWPSSPRSWTPCGGFVDVALQIRGRTRGGGEERAGPAGRGRNAASRVTARQLQLTDP